MTWLLAIIAVGFLSFGYAALKLLGVIADELIRLRKVAERSYERRFNQQS